MGLPFASARWLKRDGGGNEIENFLKSAPFENYPLYLGAEKLKGGVRLIRQMSRRKVKNKVGVERAKKTYLVRDMCLFTIYYEVLRMHAET